MDIDKLTTYQKTVLYHYSFIQSKLFKEQVFLTFFVSLMLMLAATVSYNWYYNDIKPMPEPIVGIIISAVVVWWWTRSIKHLTIASVFLVEMHTRIFTMMKILQDIEELEIDNEFKTILDKQLKSIETDFKQRFKHTVK